METGVTNNETGKCGKEAPKDSTPRADSVSSYDIKYNSLQTFITTCQHELENSQNPDVVQAIHKQLNLAKIAIEAMESQRYTEQHSILVNYQTNSISTASIPYGADQYIIENNQATLQPLLQHQVEDSVLTYSQVDITNEATSFPNTVFVTQQLMTQSPQDIIQQQKYQKQ